jgi:hypothetical protein
MQKARPNNIYNMESKNHGQTKEPITFRAGFKSKLTQKMGQMKEEHA